MDCERMYLRYAGAHSLNFSMNRCAFRREIECSEVKCVRKKDQSREHSDTEAMPGRMEPHGRR